MRRAGCWLTAVALACAGCGISAQPAPERLDPVRSGHPVPTVTQRLDDPPCGSASALSTTPPTTLPTPTARPC